MKQTEINRLFADVDPGKIYLRPVLDRFHEGVIITDTHGVILYMNDTQLRTGVTDRFKRYTWLGNVRGLEHIIEGMKNMVGAEATIRTNHLALWFLMENPQTETVRYRSAGLQGKRVPVTSKQSGSVQNTSR